MGQPTVQSVLPGTSTHARKVAYMMFERSSNLAVRLGPQSRLGDESNRPQADDSGTARAEMDLDEMDLDEMDLGRRLKP